MKQGAKRDGEEPKRLGRGGECWKKKSKGTRGRQRRKMAMKVSKVHLSFRVPFVSQCFSLDASERQDVWVGRRDDVSLPALEGAMKRIAFQMSSGSAVKHRQENFVIACLSMEGEGRCNIQECRREKNSLAKKRGEGKFAIIQSFIQSFFSHINTQIFPTVHLMQSLLESGSLLKLIQLTFETACQLGCDRKR